MTIDVKIQTNSKRVSGNLFTRQPYCYDKFTGQHSGPDYVLNIQSLKVELYDEELAKFIDVTYAYKDGIDRIRHCEALLIDQKCKDEENGQPEFAETF